MACEEKKAAMEAAIADLKTLAEAEAQKVAEDAKAETAQIGNELEQDNNIGVLIGAAAGGVAGGAVGGPVGAAVGTAIGTEIGKLFIFKVEMKRVEFSMDVPVFFMERQTVSFDIPKVTVTNKDIIFGLPSVQMTRVKVGQTPNFKVHGFNITVYWTDNFIDVPEPIMSEQRIVIGIPEFAMETQQFVFDTPSSKMETRTLSFDMPSITVISKISEAEKVKLKAQEITERYRLIAEDLAKRIRFLGKEKVVPLISETFGCYRQEIGQELAMVPARFDGAIAQMRGTIETLQAKKVPSDNPDYVRVSASLDQLVAQRTDALRQLEAALAATTKAETDAVHQFIDS